jgi:hypothetical protein
MQNQQFTINLAKAPWAQPCDCGSHLYESVMMFKKLSMLESPSGREEKIPVDMVICKSCGKIPSHVAEKVGGVPEELVAVKPIILDGQ